MSLRFLPAESLSKSIVDQARYPTVLLLNARSIVKKIDELSCLSASTSPDIIVVTESWLHEGISDGLLSLEGFNFFRCDRIGRIGGGVCMWVRKDFACVQMLHYLHPSPIEIVIIKLPHLKMLLIGVYIPPNLCVSTMEGISDFLTLLLDTELLSCPDLKVMICGDFNTFDSSIFEQQFCLTNCVESPTRREAFLDQIWISDNVRELYDDNATVGPPLDSSDHRTVFLFSRHVSKKPTKIVKLWDFRRSNVDKFLYLLSITDFSHLMDSDCVDELCRIFYEHVHVAMSFVPSQYVTLTSSDKPWITPLLKHLVNERWKAFRLKNWNLYHHYKEKVKNEIKKAKAVWAGRQIQSAKHVWNVVKEVRGIKQNCSLQTLVNEYGSKERLLHAIQSKLNDNFNWQADEEVLGFEDEEWDPHFNTFYIQKLLSRLDTKKSTGSDGVPTRLLREGSLYLTPAVFRIFVTSIKSRRFPACWKLADVTPIAKCKNPTVGDFRPISLTPVLSKLLERLVLESMSPKLVTLFGPGQHAFRQHGSTVSALVKIQDSITHLLDTPDVDAVRMTCLDFSKAFDRVLHNVLLNRLIRCDVNRGFILWLKDFLEHRVQRLKLDNLFGPVHPVPSGVPQGSILGPTLFACFMGSLLDIVSPTVVLYADDVTLIEPIQKGISPNDLCKIQEWVGTHGMSLNLSKSKQIVFCRRGRGDDVTYPSIPVVRELKLLGVFWNDKLSWNDHFCHILKLASQRLYVIRKLKSVLSEKELTTVYHSLISSLFLYASPLFMSMSSSASNKIEMFQNRAHRVICGKNCVCTNFPPLQSVRSKRATSFFGKCQSFSCHPLHHLVPSRMPRSSHFCLPHIRSTRRLHSFIPSMCITMNNMTKK
jgi:hypothetical protein